jgi:hypothetical protein
MNKPLLDVFQHLRGRPVFMQEILDLIGSLQSGG